MILEKIDFHWWTLNGERKLPIRNLIWLKKMRKFNLIGIGKYPMPLKKINNQTQFIGNIRTIIINELDGAYRDWR